MIIYINIIHYNVYTLLTNNNCNNSLARLQIELQARLTLLNDQLTTKIIIKINILQQLSQLTENMLVLHKFRHKIWIKDGKMAINGAVFPIVNGVTRKRGQTAQNTLKYINLRQITRFNARTSAGAPIEICETVP